MTDEPTAQELAERGILESHEHAEELSPDWTRRAVDSIAEYAKLNEFFMTEDAKAAAYKEGLEVPPADGAWGHVMRAAATRGIVHRYGRQAATSPGSHGKLMTLWRRGPGNLAEPDVTAADVATAIQTIEEHSRQMRYEGRWRAADLLDAVVPVIRALSHDL